MSKILNKKKYEIAEDLYIRAGLTGKEISHQLEISEVTLSKWKAKGDWENRKSELTVSPLRIKELLLKEANKIANGEKSTIDSDKLSKITASIDRLDKRISARIVFDVLKELDNWIAEIDPTKALEFVQYHKQFLIHRIKLEG